MRSRFLTFTGAALFLCHVSPVTAAPFAYVPNSGDNTVSVIDTANDAVVATVPVGADPFGVAVHPSGRLVYVANRSFDDPTSGTVSVIDAVTNTVKNTIHGLVGPGGITINDSGTFAYVVSDRGLVVIDLVRDFIALTIPVGTDPLGVAMNSTLGLLYVTNHLGEEPQEGLPCSFVPLAFCNVTLSIVDTAGERRSAVLIGDNLNGVAVNPVNGEVYVAYQFLEPGLLVGAVAVVSPTGDLLARIPLDGPAGQAFGVAVSPAGDKVYVTSSGTGAVTGSVSVLDVPTRTIAATLEVPGAVGGASGLALNPAGTRLYVPEPNNAAVAVIDTASLSVVDTIPVGRVPLALGRFVGPAEILPPPTPIPTTTSSPTRTPTPTTTPIPTFSFTPTPPASPSASPAFTATATSTPSRPPASPTFSESPTTAPRTATPSPVARNTGGNSGCSIARGGKRGLGDLLPLVLLLALAALRQRRSRETDKSPRDV